MLGKVLYGFESVFEMEEAKNASLDQRKFSEDIVSLFDYIN